MNNKSDYSEKYKELELIGRGNFGTATLVENKKDKAIYVAKKVILGSLSQKEIESAEQEVKLLRELQHPHIVSYKECFVEEGILIIVMEYCQEGDLKNLITKMTEKKEYFTETQILNWFLQIMLALEFIHRNKVLHRDIKTSNVFLKSDGTVKVGDFGISKSLENSNDKAFTVVGTPYYMSPEVCENKPYTLKSDVWALGCVLYEMCTLAVPFTSKNLLGLIYKIVRDDFDPLTPNVSAEMTELIRTVRKLLTKDENLRPSIYDVIKIPIIQKAIRQFISSEGNRSILIKVPFGNLPINNQPKEISKNNDKQAGTVLGNTIQVVDLIDSEEKSYRPKTSKVLSRDISQGGSKKVESLRQEVKKNQYFQTSRSNESHFNQASARVQEQVISLNNNSDTNRQRHTPDSSPTETGNQHSYRQDQYEKQLRNIQRLIPNFHARGDNNSFGNKSKLSKEPSIPSSASTVSGRADAINDLEKEMFDVTQESLSLSQTKGVNFDQNNDECDDDLMMTCVSQDMNEQLGLTKGKTKKQSILLKGGKTMKESLIVKQINSKKNKAGDDSDEYEEDFEDEYEEDFEDLSDGEEQRKKNDVKVTKFENEKVKNNTRSSPGN